MNSLLLQVSPPNSNAVQDLSTAVVTDPQVLANIPLPTTTSIDTPVGVTSRTGKRLAFTDRASGVTFHLNSALQKGHKWLHIRERAD